MIKYPDFYLHIIHCSSGDEYIQKIKPRWVLDLKTRLEYWIKEEFGGELVLAGDITPNLDGEYYARIMADGRPPDSVICWKGGGFYLKYNEE